FRAQTLDVVRIVEGAAQSGTQENDAAADDAAQHESERQHQLLLWRNCFHRQYGVVDDAHVAGGAGLDYTQFLGTIEQRGIQRRIDLRVAFETAQLLLRTGQLIDFLLQLIMLSLYAAQLAFKRLHLRMSGGVSFTQFVALENQFGALLLQ